jgi:hypothetical protein
MLQEDRRYTPEFEHEPGHRYYRPLRVERFPDRRVPRAPPGVAAREREETEAAAARQLGEASVDVDEAATAVVVVVVSAPDEADGEGGDTVSTGPGHGADAADALDEVDGQAPAAVVVVVAEEEAEAAPAGGADAAEEDATDEKGEGDAAAAAVDDADAADDVDADKESADGVGADAPAAAPDVVAAAATPLRGVSYERMCWAVEAVGSRAFKGLANGGAPFALYAAVSAALIAGAVALSSRNGVPDTVPIGMGVLGALLPLPSVLQSTSAKTCALLPAIDSCNHRGTGYLCDIALDPLKNAFVMSAKTDVAIGQEVTISYGDKHNDDLLQYFGFVEVDCAFDQYVVADPVTALETALDGAGMDADAAAAKEDLRRRLAAARRGAQGHRDRREGPAEHPQRSAHARADLSAAILAGRVAEGALAGVTVIFNAHVQNGNPHQVQAIRSRFFVISGRIT